jgi:Ead/Ea22-like protein
MNTELRRLAEAATPGPWQVINGHYPGFREIEGPSFQVSIVMSATNLTFSDGTQRETDAGFIAAANPQTILELLDKIDQLQADCEKFKNQTFKAQAEYRTLSEAYSQLQAERDALKKAVDAMVADGWLHHGPEGMSDAQKLVHEALAAMKEQP